MSNITVYITANNKSITYGDSLPQFDYQITFEDGNDHSNDIIIGNNPISIELLSNNQTNYDPTRTYQIILDPTKFTADNSVNTYIFDNLVSFTNGTLTVNKKELVVSVNNIRKNYDGNYLTQSDCSVGITGYVYNDTINSLIGSLTYSGSAFTNKDAIRNGSYTISVSGYSSDNYFFTYNDGTLIIDPISLKFMVDSVEKTYDNIPFTSSSCSVDLSNPVSPTNYVNGESSANLNGTIIYDGTCINAVLAKTDNGDQSDYYTITASGLTNNNYNIEFISGKLFIYRKPLTITAHSITKMYNGQTLSSSSFTVIYNDFISGENESSLSGSLSFNSECLNAVNYNPSGYPITPSGFTSNNYKITYVSGTLTINKVTLTLFTKDRNSMNQTPQYVYGTTWDTLDYSPYYTIGGYVNNEDYNSANITGKPTFWIQNLNVGDKLNAGYYNTTLFDIGSLSSQNYSFQINNSGVDYYPQIAITKATLTLSPKQPTSSYTYGDSINYTDLYSISGYVLNDNFNNTSLINQSPIIMFGENRYISGSRMNAGTYDISLNSDISGLNDNNYNFSISNPSTLPTVIINKKQASIAYNPAPITAVYGDSNITATIFNRAIFYTLSYNDDRYSSINPNITESNISNYISYNYTDSNGQQQNIISTTPAGTYTISINKSNYNSNALNYVFSSYGSYTLTIGKKPVYVRPYVGNDNPRTTINFGETMTSAQIKTLWEVYGFINGHTQASEIDSTTNPDVVLRRYLNNTYQDFYYTGQVVPVNDTNNNHYGLYINPGGLTTKSTSNYYLHSSNNSTLRPFIVNRITFDSVGLQFNSWISFLPEIPYGVGLSQFQLNIHSPKEPHLNQNVGTVTFVGQEINTGVIDNVNFALNGHPNIGIYRLTAVLTIDNTNYVYDTRNVTNNSYTLEILKNVPIISHWNPAPILKGSSLTSTELSAYTNVSNDANAIIYCKNDGTTINIGDIVNDDVEIIEKVNDYTNTNFYPYYTFRKQKITTL